MQVAYTYLKISVGYFYARGTQRNLLFARFVFCVAGPGKTLLPGCDSSGYIEQERGK